MANKFNSQILKRIFLITQAEKPNEIRKILLNAAVSDSWVGMIVNINTAIFVGLIALTADFGATQSLIFLSVQLGITTIGAIIMLFLQIRRQSNRPVAIINSERLLTFTDLLVMCGWGFGILPFISPLNYDRSLLVIVLLTAAGIGFSALNARLLRSLILGRVILFSPGIIYFLYLQPPFWGLLVCTLFFACAVSIGIGYAIHVQHLNEANFGLKLREASVLLEQQSFSLERSMSLEHKAQSRLLKETKLREHFLHSISHDLNQPLNALGFYLNDLGRRKISATAQKTVSAAQQCLGSAKALIQNVSQLAWIKGNLSPPNIGEVELQPLMDRIGNDTSLIAAQKNVAIVLVPSSLKVLADEDYLERVLRNLVQNAIQYTRGGQHSRGARILIGVRRREGGMAEIVVADNGLGISTEHQKKIFEEFYQIKAHTKMNTGNIGLGLTIVNDLVSAMNGKIVLKSIINRGSQFGVILPVSQLRSVNRDGQFNNNNISSIVVKPKDKPNRVLLVDDEQEYLSDITAMLEELGFVTDTAGSPREFGQINQQIFDNYQFAILDFDLGDGLTAIDILNRCDKNLFPSSLIISQFDDPNLILHLKEKGGRFLKKPFSCRDLENTLQVLQTRNPLDEDI